MVKSASRTVTPQRRLGGTGGLAQKTHQFLDNRACLLRAHVFVPPCLDGGVVHQNNAFFLHNLTRGG